jgi:hypothetical protein
MSCCCWLLSRPKMTYNVSLSKTVAIFVKHNIYWIVYSKKVVYFIMQRMTGIPRNQVFSSLEDFTWKSVRFIDAFVRSIIVRNFRFSVQTIKGEGSWAFIIQAFLQSICMVILIITYHFLFGYRLMSVNLKDLYYIILH